MQADISLIIRLQQTLFADPRRIALLKQIQHSGSISQGARQAGISYKSAWDAMDTMNRLSGRTLVERVTGGKGGGGAQLTPFGLRLIQLYDLLGQMQQKAFDALQDDAVPLDSLLGAIARSSLQTSARNQLFGTLLTRDGHPPQQTVTVLLADGVTRLSVALTARSAERLGLEVGKAVLLLIKAPQIQLGDVDDGAENRLPVTVVAIEAGESLCEAIVQLGSGDTLCVTLPREEVARQSLLPGMQTTAHFHADNVILATLV
ncbi:molybdenum-dependent transcriptional regulator [Pantoea sp. 1.19]|uniref:molybdenum-dependent transcriptional regulator n=1 Tax=Pantoea sp. 1.19 TaxID=1925589 RepID=UPI000948AA7A|nr:molybdenum-dependent transcriptional regulator [Pantoea sp. 1.19]